MLRSALSPTRLVRFPEGCAETTPAGPIRDVDVLSWTAEIVPSSTSASRRRHPLEVLVTIYAVPGQPGSPATVQARYDNWIGGEFVAPVEGKYFENASPVTGQVYCQGLDQSRSAVF